MSIVAARYITPNKIQIASDSFVLYGSNIKRKDSKKIIRVSYDDGSSFIVGSSGSISDKFSFIDFLNLSDKIVLNTRIEVFKMMCDFRIWKKTYFINSEDTQTTFIIICQAGMFTYWNEHELIEEKDFVAIGIGELPATALMHNGCTPEEAVQVCIDVVDHCDGEIKKIEYEIENNSK